MILFQSKPSPSGKNRSQHRNIAVLICWWFILTKPRNRELNSVVYQKEMRLDSPIHLAVLPETELRCTLNHRRVTVPNSTGFHSVLAHGFTLLYTVWPALMLIPRLCSLLDYLIVTLLRCRTGSLSLSWFQKMASCPTGMAQCLSIHL